MNNLPEEDSIILDAFLSGSSDFLVGEHLRTESKNKTASLFERSTSTLIAKIDFSHPIPLIRMRRNFGGYEYLPQYFESKSFVPSKSSQEGILEFRYYKLEGYTIQETSINTLWKSFRKLITKNKQVKILHEHSWCQITNIIHEDFTYVIKILKGNDIVIATPNMMMTWAEPEEEAAPSFGSSIWATGIMADQKDKSQSSSPFERTTRNLVPDSKRQDLENAVESISTDLKGLHQYVEQLFSFLADDKKAYQLTVDELKTRLECLETIGVLNTQLPPVISIIQEVEEEEDPAWDLPQGLDNFNLTSDDSSRFEESFGGSTSLMMPLN